MLETQRQLHLARDIQFWSTAMDLMLKEGRPDVLVMTYGYEEMTITPNTAATSRIALEGFAQRHGFPGGVEDARLLVAEALSQELLPSSTYQS